MGREKGAHCRGTLQQRGQTASPSLPAAPWCAPGAAPVEGGRLSRLLWSRRGRGRTRRGLRRRVVEGWSGCRGACALSVWESQPSGARSWRAEMARARDRDEPGGFARRCASTTTSLQLEQPPCTAHFTLHGLPCEQRLASPRLASSSPRLDPHLSSTLSHQQPHLPWPRGLADASPPLDQVVKTPHRSTRSGPSSLSLLALPLDLR